MGTGFLASTHAARRANRQFQKEGPWDDLILYTCILFVGVF